MNEKNLQLFRILTAKFEYEHMFYSFIDDDDPIFQFIVEWGKSQPNEIIPLLLGNIEEDPSWSWTVALHKIVGDNSPVIPDEEAGRSEYIMKAWLDWGRVNGYLKDKTC